MIYQILVWGESQQRSYHTLKHAIIIKSVSMLPNVDEEFILRTDASDVELGATLLQHRDGQISPVAYASRKLLDRERRDSAMGGECLGVVRRIEKIAMYVYGKQFTL